MSTKENKSASEITYAVALGCTNVNATIAKQLVSDHYELERDNKALEKSLKLCMAALRKNLSRANEKHEMVMYDALMEAEKTLGHREDENA